MPDVDRPEASCDIPQLIIDHHLLADEKVFQGLETLIKGSLSALADKHKVRRQHTTSSSYLIHLDVPRVSKLLNKQTEVEIARLKTEEKSLDWKLASVQSQLRLLNTPKAKAKSDKANWLRREALLKEVRGELADAKARRDDLKSVLADMTQSASAMQAEI